MDKDLLTADEARAISISTHRNIDKKLSKICKLIREVASGDCADNRSLRYAYPNTILNKEEVSSIIGELDYLGFTINHDNLGLVLIITW